MVYKRTMKDGKENKETKAEVSSKEETTRKE